jgi:epoxide hydrolase-like predicted phosphatase
MEAVLFDFGGVFTASPFEAMEAAGAEFGTDPARLREIVFGPYDHDTNHPWHCLERGEISVVAARQAIIDAASEQGLVDFDPFRVLLKLKADEGGARGVVVARARRLRAEGYRTALVTNNVREFSRGWRSLIPVDELFDEVIDSSQEGVRKPDPAIFRLALERLGGVPPDRAVFLDDFEGNLVAARALGIASVLVESDPSGAIAELDRLLMG